MLYLKWSDQFLDSMTNAMQSDDTKLCVYQLKLSGFIKALT